MEVDRNKLHFFRTLPDRRKWLARNHTKADGSTVFDALGRQAKKMSQAALIALEVSAFGATLAILGLSPDRMLFALPFVAVGMFGLWGVAEHLRWQHTIRRGDAKYAALSAFQVIAAFVGAGAAVAVIFALGGWAIGTVIS